MALTGDFAGLQKIAAKITSTRVVPFKLAVKVAPLLQTTIDQTFAGKRNVYGDPWQAIQAKTIARGSKSIGIRSGALLAAIRVAPQGAKVRVPLGLDYGKYLIARKRSPYPRNKLPPSWKPIIERAAEAAMREALGG